MVRDNVENLRRDLTLATIRDDIDLAKYGLKFSASQFEPRPIDGIADFYRRLTMKRHLSEVESLVNPEATIHDLWAST